MRFLAFVLIATPAALGQTFGEVTGRLSDATGASIPEATVTLTNASTNGIRTTVSTDAGGYTLPAVPPGVYNIRVEHPGFKAAVANNFEVQVQQTVRLDFTLSVGQVSESVEVQATADQLAQENATVGTVIGNRGIVGLPLNGRNYLNLVALSPNANTLSPASGQAGSRQGGDRGSQSISAAGQRIMFNYFTLDGVNNTDPNFNTYVVLPSIDALQEFKVQTGVYPAEFGHQATQINVLTKSGGNIFHGALFEFLRNDKLDASPYSFTSVHQKKNPFKWNDYGFEIDGPVRIPKVFNGKDKLFFMANYEALRRRQSTQAIYSVPTASMFAGNFSNLSAIIHDPTNKVPFPGNIVPSSRFDPISQKLLKYYVPANVAGAGNSLVNNYVRPQSAPNNRDSFVLRMDFVESSKSQWSGRYSWGDENASQEGLTLDGSKLLTNYEQYTGSNTRTFTPNLVNEARFGYTRFFNSIGSYLAFNQDVVSEVGIPNLRGGDPVTWGIPGVGITSYSGFGDSSEGPYVNNNRSLQFVENLSWIRGKHTFRFGGEYMRQVYNQVGNQFARGAFTFSPNATTSPSLTGGDGFAELLLGTLFQSDVAVAVATANFVRGMKHAWIDDTWKVTPRLTLSLGLRYELNPPFYNTLGNLVTVYLPRIHFQPQAPRADYPKMMRQGTCSDPYGPGVNIQWPQIDAVCNNGTLSREMLATSYKDFAPRVGIAYSIGTKWVIRAGYGMFYNQDQGNAVFDMARQIAGRLRVVTQVAGTGNVFWNNALASVVAGAKPQITNPQGFVNAYSHRSSYTMMYLLNVQRQLSNSLVVEAGYLGSASRHLYGFQDANPKTPGTTPLAQRQPFSNFSVIQLVHDGGVGNYNAASIKFTERFSRGLSLISSYTFAKSVDTTSGIRVQGFDQLFPQNSFCLNPCERGLSSFHVKHRFLVSSLYELPVGKGRAANITNPIANGIIGGWQIGGIWTVQTGLPQAVVTGADRSNTTLGYDRPDATGVSPYLSNPSPSLWFNPAAYVGQTIGTFGNLGRNNVVGPGIFALDFALHKAFQMPYNEAHRLQLRMEAFNIMNHPVWSNPNGNISAGAPYPGAPATSPRSGFGRITATAVPMRQIQFGLKYTF